ncbi:glycerate kinase [Agromyces sp. H3Y2-19a]|uniref:glycerate kinase n=1 Tax=Agromyces chromiiresistens TaxID=3030835 RepID=UPI0023BA3382|nr:glycerate kinase [Agromyces chromiiresistens]MDF0513921.1 glycerate kinase [Agromyces chromiiresistens]
MKVVVAPDSFKGTVGADEAAKLIAAGWKTRRPEDELVLKPMADGGEGTLAALATAIPGASWEHARVFGPDGRAMNAPWLMLPDGTAAVELASASGITLMDALSPLDAHTFGLGQVISTALDAGVTRVLVALGSSASTDGGSGMLSALGGRFTTADGQPISLGGRGLMRLRTTDLAGLARVPSRGVIGLSDVTNPLLGPHGAAAVFGPQKGADADEVDVLERALDHYVSVLGEAGVRVAPDSAGAGAAGGTGYGLMVWGASLELGASVVADAIGLAEAVTDADFVITGEGQFDGQSLAGKVPSEVLGIARRAHVPTALVAGRIVAATDGFALAISLTESAGSTRAAISDPRRWLIDSGSRLAAKLAVAIAPAAPPDRTDIHS